MGLLSWTRNADGAASPVPGTTKGAGPFTRPSLYGAPRGRYDSFSKTPPDPPAAGAPGSGTIVALKNVGGTWYEIWRR